LSLQITHVRKNNDGDIARLKGSGWEDSVAGVISDIELKKFSYTVTVGGVSADVQVVPATVYRKKHLRTTADSATRNNLDLLPAF
jgi:hypothetical protein